MPSLTTRRSALAVIAAGVAFGTTGTTQTFAPAGAEPLSVGAVRLLVGGLLLAVLGGARHVRRSGWRPPRFSTGFWWVLLGAAAVMAYQATFFAGTRANGVAVGTVVALGSSPLFAGLFEWLGFRQRPTRRWAVATGLAVLGMVLLTGLIGAVSLQPAGLLASLGAGACYACYTVATKAVLRRGWGATSAVSAMLGLGAVLAGFVLLGTDNAWVATGRGLAVVAWLGVVTVVVAYLLLGQGLRGLSAATATTLTLAEPATASLLGVLLLGEDLTGWQYLGIATVAAGVVIAGTERTASDPPATPRS
ncbi:MAG: EamA family transporter [Propionicimonas sp.]